MRPRLAIIRGHFYSREEALLFKPLEDEFDITLFISPGSHQDTNVGLPIVELPCLDSRLNSLSFGAYGKIYGLINNLTGVDSEFVFGLGDKLRGFDVAYTNDYNYLLTYQVARLKRHLDFKLATVHWQNIPFALDRKPIAKFFKYRVYDQVDGFFAMSERAKAALLLEGIDESKIFVTRNGTDTEKFKPNESSRLRWRERYGIKPDDMVILFVGRVRASKGAFELIYAAKRLLNDPMIDRTKLKIVIAGKGPAEQEVDKRIQMLGLDRNVIRTGFIPRSEIDLVHNMADIFCLPSTPRKYWQEQLGAVFLEAMACGKPIVSTLSGSIPEVVGDAGILVQPNDHVALYEGLKSIILDRKLRMSLGLKARDRAERLFSPAAISENLRRGLLGCLGRRKN
ncbi:MAG TPA: glycosyltransferase family 4 protein [Candidatus Acidoferrales bacterium]|nr:glycosyltransferase family 4 protein [Candidatus Acidoferrales bacterium]